MPLGVCQQSLASVSADSFIVALKNGAAIVSRFCSEEVRVEFIYMFCPCERG